MRKNPDYLTLYKESEIAVNVHAVDASAWLEQGWNVAPSIPSNNPGEAKTPDSLPVTLVNAESLNKQPAKKKVADA